MTARTPPPRVTLAGLAARLEQLAPAALAEPWDNVGLQLGDPAAPLRRVMVCLEVTAPILAEAERLGADALIAHHPLIFQPLRSVRADRPGEALVAGVIRAGLGLIVAHTNLDCAEWGTNEALARSLGFEPAGPLDPRELEAGYKFVIFTPEGHEQAIIDAIDLGGGGRIGDYTHCTFRMPGTGSFRGGETTHPAIGEARRFEQAAELRIETVVASRARRAVLDAVLAVHPYEEPAWEFYPLAGAAGSGLGCLVDLPKPMIGADLALRVRSLLELDRVRVSGPAGRTIRRLAICTGSGGSLLEKVEAAGAQAYITGEATYHHGIEAHQRELMMIEIGHFESERLMAGPLALCLADDPVLARAGLEIFPASDDLQPFQTF